MNKKSTGAAKKPSFFQYISEKPQRDQFLVLTGLYLAATIIIGILYPFPFTTADTGNYVYCAQLNTYGGYRPMGYSNFIRFFHNFSESIHFVYIWQSLFNYIAVISFLFTLRYFFRLSKTVFYIFSAVLILHPDILHNTNSVLSDSLFNSLTLLWITTGIWMIMEQNLKSALLHCVVLYFAINVRYIGLFYPVVSSLLFIVQFKQWKFYSAIALAPILILVISIQSVKNKTQEIFNQDTFSAFSGWASANNAVAMIPYINLRPDEIPDPEIRSLHELVTHFGDTCYTWDHIKDTDFMWDKRWPGKALLGYNIQQLHIPYNAAWVYTGMEWKKYGDYLKKKYPMQYVQHFMIPNAGGVFEVFPYGPEKEYVPDNTSKTYFNVSTDKYVFKSALFEQVYGYRLILYWTMIISFFGISIIMIAKRKKYFEDRSNVAVTFFLIGFALLYIAMSIYTHPIQNFRYLIPIYPAVMAIVAIGGSRLSEIFNGNRTPPSAA